MSENPKRYQWYTQDPKAFRRQIWDWLFDGHRGGGLGKFLKRFIQPRRQLSQVFGARVIRGMFVVLIISCIGVFLKRESQQQIAEMIFDNLESISLGSAGVIFLLEIQDRRKRDHYEAWQVINSAMGQTGSGGRIQALEDLNRDSVDLEGVAAPQADLSGINLNFGKLRRANLEWAKLDDANLEGACMVSANLRCADLMNANLNRVDLMEANLEGAHLEFANLENAYLIGANLEGAYLVGANLKGAYLMKANLENAMGITQDQLIQSQLCCTRLPVDICLAPDRDCEKLGFDASRGGWTKPRVRNR